MTFQKLKDNIVSMSGNGQAWLDSLETIVAKSKVAWQLEQIRPFDNLSYNYVLRAKKDSQDVVLKIFYDEDAYTREKAALEFFDGVGCALMLESDDKNKALLLEKVNPGIPLELFFNEEHKCYDDIARLLTVLHLRNIEEAVGFSPLKDWIKSLFEGKSGQIPLGLLETARDKARKLLASTAQNVMLHADFHHENILFSKKSKFMAIDPKGVIGDRAYDLAPFMINPLNYLLKHQNPKLVLENRLESFSKSLNLDKTRIKDWAFVHAVLGACWAVEDGANPQNFIETAELIKTL